MGTVKRRNNKKLKHTQQVILTTAQDHDNISSAGSGIAGRAGIRLKPEWAPQEDRRVESAPDNAAVIVMDNNPEYAKLGGDFASRVAIIAGVGGHHINGDDTVKDLIPVYDAAGVFVVQKGDPQNIFGKHAPLINPAIAGTKLKQEKNKDKGKSHVTTLADTVQVVARNGGINLYAGGVGSTLSTGVVNTGQIGVNLIYGNNIEKKGYELDSLVKGKKLQKVLDAMINRINELSGVVFDINKSCLVLKTVLAGHTHLPSGPIGGGTPSVELIVGVALTVSQDVYNTLNNVTNIINGFTTAINKSKISRGNPLSSWHKLN